MVVGEGASLEQGRWSQRVAGVKGCIVDGGDVEEIEYLMSEAKLLSSTVEDWGKQDTYLNMHWQN